jgi:hypothetical protein
LVQVERLSEPHALLEAIHYRLVRHLRELSGFTEPWAQVNQFKIIFVSVTDNLRQVKHSVGKVTGVTELKGLSYLDDEKEDCSV